MRIWPFLSPIVIFLGTVAGVVFSGCQVWKPTASANFESTHGETRTAQVPSGQVGASEMHEMMRKWLGGIPCHPPCWEGIVPGQTTITETLTILRRNPLVAELKIHETAGSAFVNEGEVYWRWDGVTRGGGLVAYHERAVVYAIKITDPFRSLTFQDIVGVYGEPSHMHAWARPSSDESYTIYGLDVVYVPQGLALGWTGSPDSGDNIHKPEFGPEWRDFCLYFFEPTEAGFALAYGNPGVVEGLTPWRGIQNFDAYCLGTRCD